MTDDKLCPKCGEEFKFFTINDVAKLFSVGPRAVKRWMADGLIQYERVNKGGSRPTPYFTPDHIREFVGKRNK